LFDESIATRQRLAAEGATASDRAEALWQLLSLAGLIGELQLAQDSIVTLVRDYPWHPRAMEALDLSYAPSPVVTAAERGIVFFEQAPDDQAVEAFEAALAEDDSAAAQGTARYHLALLAERAGDNDAAMEHYDAGLAALAGGGSDALYGDLAWERALLLEALGRTEEAITGYIDLADAAPGSTRAPEGLFRAGFLRYQQGLATDAGALFERYLAVAGEEAPRARVWLAKSSLAVGDAASANAHLAAAVDAGPWDYYGLRADALLELASPLTLDETADLEIETDWTETEAWLATVAGPEDAEATQGFLEGLPMRRGLELLEAGLADEAHDQFDAIRNDIADEPWLLYRLARALDERSLTEAAARTAARLVLGHPDAPAELLRLAYPVGWPDLVAQEAEANDLPPLLLLALVRQESFFQPDAESFAGALGLTQVIPTTAEEIAGQLEEDEFVTSDLLRPAVSLRFGAHYLGKQLEFLASDIPAALAAYNGGPGNAQGWQEASLGDPEVFLETIAFAETRAYVELVLEHYAHYRYAYGLTEQASLPLG
jgi:soluble lytic murein transglycosylase